MKVKVEFNNYSNICDTQIQQQYNRSLNKEMKFYNKMTFLYIF